MYNKIKVKHKQPEKRNVQKERDFVDNYEAWNHLLVELFKDILDIEEKAVITSEFKDITNNDMHIMEAVDRCEKYVCDCKGSFCHCGNADDRCQ